MTDKKSITIGGSSYAIDSLSQSAREKLASLRFVESQIQQKQNEWAIADTARFAYAIALKREAKK